MSRKELTLAQRSEIVTLYKEGLSTWAISKKVKRAQSTVRDTIHNWSVHGTLHSKKRTGRPPKVTPQIVQSIDRFIQKHDEAVPKEIQKKLNLNVSPRTIFNIRRSLGYKATHGKKRIILSAKDKQKRVSWCKKHLKDTFSNVIFTDEKPFELYKRRRLSYAKIGQERKPKPIVKYPPKIQCWGGISREGKTQLAFWMGRPKSADYCDTLKRCLLPAINEYYPARHRFFQDRDSTHTSKHTAKWLADNQVKVEMCPVRSPDLNPIEMIWNTLEYKTMAHNPSTEKELKKWVVYEWNRIDTELINRTINKMIERIPKIIESGGELVD